MPTEVETEEERDERADADVCARPEPFATTRTVRVRPQQSSESAIDGQSMFGLWRLSQSRPRMTG